ncbi:MAG: histidine kinase, partial [Lacisediminimonas sp.]|nr:histidine kinase [Lacisediminimonas sp.]
GQCAILVSSACDEIQGYLFSRPIPAPAIEAILTECRQLAPHLRRARKPQRSLLLADGESDVVASL